eukprot:506906_1
MAKFLLTVLLLVTVVEAAQEKKGFKLKIEYLDDNSKIQNVLLDFAKPLDDVTISDLKEMIKDATGTPVEDQLLYLLVGTDERDLPEKGDTKLSECDIMDGSKIKVVDFPM